ncbi:mitochondrial FAD carrier protein flx1 [Microbotryomycetes sp. JL201]|nr:mitochondrial FAD carrier protein flx1 [Microbotryomycetes sp. JL201]
MGTATASSVSTATPSFLPSYSLDQAAAGIGAGLVSTMCMQPLDLLKVKLQVSTTRQHGTGGAFGLIWRSLREITKTEGGVKGLYRGVTPNLVGNASSWGLYFLWYTMIKERMGAEDGVKLSAGQHLLASASSGVVTAILTNPLWVIKTRMYTTSRSSENAYKGVIGTFNVRQSARDRADVALADGLWQITKKEGIRGHSKGLLLAIIGVSNGAIQFMTYEELKKWRQADKRRRLGPNASEDQVKNLSNLEYILMSGSAKLVAIGITYPYQVVRSRIQYQTTGEIAPYTSIPNVVSRTWAKEGFTGFYKGLATNAVRILPGTCVTFVVYEQISRWLSRKADEKLQRRGF